MEINKTEEKIYKIVRKAVEDVLDEKLIELRLALIPEVDDVEMADIEKSIGEPGKFKDYDYDDVDLKNVDLLNTNLPR